MAQPFKTKLEEQQLLLAPMVTIDSSVTVEILAACGYDWLFIDAEHSPMTYMDIQRVVRAAGAKMPCLVRLEETAELPIKKALDAGAVGIIAPMVNSAWDARNVVQWAKYPPIGQRGVGLGRAHGYGLNFQDYVTRANEDTVVVVQAEHIASVNNIDSIVQVSGVDAVFVGPYDLSASLGVMGQVDHPEVVKAIDHVTGVCREANMPIGLFGLDAAAVQPYVDRGYSLVVAGVDTLLLGQAAQAMLQEIRA